MSQKWETHHKKSRRNLGKTVAEVIFIYLLTLGIYYYAVPYVVSGSSTIEKAISTIINGNQQTPVAINQNWVSEFMAIVNQYRANESAPPLSYSSYLSSFAEIRFNTMTANDNYEISHYGFDQDFNSYFAGQSISAGEVVFFPAGETPEQFVQSLIKYAPLHWELLMNPTFTHYGYYIGIGKTVVAESYGSITPFEIPGPNINVTQYIINEGYTPVVENSTWLVIELSS